MRPRIALVALVLTLAVSVVPASADAYYGEGAQIVSADFERLEQGDDSTVFAAISADGRYVAFQTRARNFFADDDPDPAGKYRTGGIFRVELATKALVKVADGDLFDEASNAFLRRGASNPSISADGRYIAFVTAEPLVAADLNDNVDAYVRDMDVAIGSPGAYDLVSALDGGDVGAEYGAPESPFPGSEPGAELSRGVAISADGQRVAFRTEAMTDLPAGGAVDAPGRQIFLRDRVADTTTLVTAQWEQGSNSMTDVPAGGAYGAALSADGTTVAWNGGNVATQTRILGGENADPGFVYYLWRRVGADPAALTRRITGLADPDDPACPADATTLFNRTSTGPCYGPLTDQEGLLATITGQVPALSADGYSVAFLTGSGPRPNESTNPGLDLFMTDMRPGLTRKAATIELTRDTVGTDLATAAPLGSVGMSADGRYLAITTVRTGFVLPTLTLLGEPRAIPGVRDLYVADLQAGTLDRVARSYSGGDTDADVLNGPTISADGSRVAFASFAANLFYGDANKVTDAFVAERQPEPGGDQPPPPPGSGGPDSTSEDLGGPRISVRATTRAGGKVVLTVSVPAAGGVKALAKGAAGQPRKQRTLASAAGRATGAARSTVELVLRPVGRYRGELRELGALRARAVVTYVASRGGRRASASRQIVFRQQLAKGGSAAAGKRPVTAR